VPNQKCTPGQPCCWLKSGDCSSLITAPNANDTIGILPGRARAARPAPTASFLVSGSGPPRTRLDPRFVSVGCESWEWLFDPGALDHPMLQAVLGLLSPGFLRVGGISSDQVHWVGNGTEQLNLHPGAEENPLNTTTFDALIMFCRRANITLIFDLNELWNSNALGFHRQEGQPWDPSATVKLLEHAKASGAVSSQTIILGPIKRLNGLGPSSAGMDWVNQAPEWLGPIKRWNVF